jgi:hypothetical protein
MRVRHTVTTALVLLAALPAAAQAAQQLKTERFEVSVKGVQTTAWSLDDPGMGQCNPGAEGQGTEVVRFNTAKPTTIVATRFSPKLVTFGTGEVQAQAKVTRRGKVVSDPFDPRCGGKGGGGQSTPDCGTKRAKIWLSLSYEGFGKPSGVKLRNHPFPMPGLYGDCPVIGTYFPALLDQTSNGKGIASDWPVKEMMDGKAGKTIVIGRGRKVTEDATSKSETTIRWEVTFRRVGGARRPKAAASGETTGPECTLKARRSYRLSPGGIPVRITCDRRAEVFGLVNHGANTEAYRLINPFRHPGAHGWSPRRWIDAHTPTTFRVPLQPFAVRALKQAGGRSKVLLTLGVRQDDGTYRNNPDRAGWAFARLSV